MQTVVVKDTSISYGIREIVEQLPGPSTVQPGSEITLRFASEEFIYLTGLVLLAAWRKALPPGVIVTLDDRQCKEIAKKFLTNTGFREIISTGHEMPSAHKRLGRVPLRPITNQFTTDATVNEIVTIFDEYAGHVEDTTPFRQMITELCENVLSHSEFSAPGYVCARILENSNTVEITIADTGVGIRQSYMNGTNPGIKEKILKGANPVELAIDGLNSSKPRPVSGRFRSYFGFGLFVTRRLVEENRGQLFIVSGNDSLYVNRQFRNPVQLKNPWSGTFVGIVLDLANPLPLEEVYQKAMDEYADIRPAPPRMQHPQSLSTTEILAPSPSEAQVDTKSDTAEATSKFSENDVDVKKIELHHYGTELLTRDAGTAIRADIAGYLAAGYTVQVSLDNVSDITPSVADEAFAKLADIMGHNAFEERVRIVGGTRIAQRLVSFVLKTRRSKSS